MTPVTLTGWPSFKVGLKRAFKAAASATQSAK
jgi:hypothetical protein